MKIWQRGLLLEPGRIAAYRKACLYMAEPGCVPLPYPEMHFTQLIAEAVVSPQFPLSPLGLIHVGQEVESLEPLRPGDVVDAQTELTELRHTKRGYELDFAMRVERNDELVWKGRATLLSRSEQTRATVRGPATRSLPPPKGSGVRTLLVSVPRNTGVSYARVSGDWNPHHLWRATALPLGYRRPITHGMWTFARALSPVLERAPKEVPLSAFAAFKRPVFMPGRMRIEAPPLSAETPLVSFAAYDARSGEPHVLGQARLSSR